MVSPNCMYLDVYQDYLSGRKPCYIDCIHMFYHQSVSIDVHQDNPYTWMLYCIDYIIMASLQCILLNVYHVYPILRMPCYQGWPHGNTVGGMAKFDQLGQIWPTKLVKWKYLTNCYLVIILPKLIEFGQVGQFTWLIWSFFDKKMVKFVKVMKFNSKIADKTKIFWPTNK